jgi:hypothetical protein
MNIMEPLHWPDSWINASKGAHFLGDIPFFGLRARTLRNINQQLMRRSINVFELWGDNIDTYKCLCCVSPIVKEYFFWRNTLFIPDDPCEILFWDPSTELRFGTALSMLGDLFSFPKTFWDDLGELKYGELINRIIPFLKK